MKIVTWNVNSIKSRLLHVTAYLQAVRPDVLLLQELKCPDEAFPLSALDEAGYHVAVVGQKAYNGVGILSKRPVDVEHRCLPGDSGDPQARYVEAVIENAKGIVRVASIYLPNGNPIETEKFAYKLDWMDRLIAHVRTLLSR